MNYDANTTHWKRGDLVIHDCDEKKPHMLMRVVGFTDDGLVMTVYNNPREDMPAVHRKKVWKNTLADLHDPARFGIDVTEYSRMPKIIGSLAMCPNCEKYSLDGNTCRKCHYTLRDDERAFVEKALEPYTKYDIMPFSDGNGEFYTARDRSASWKESRPGYITVSLNTRRAEKEIAIRGHVIQPDKARDICRVWIEDRHISSQLVQDRE